MIKLILVNWIFIIVLMIFAWIIYLRTNNPGIIDVFWSITISVSGFNYFFHEQSNLISIVFLVLLFLWAIRLSGYLFITRIIPRKIEKRYAFVKAQSSYKTKLNFLIHYQFQGILAMIIALPFYFIAQQSENIIFICVSLLIILIGIAGESLSDYQLQQFRKNKPGLVCNTGLWQYSRHPNYFFELLIWVGFALAGFSFPIGLLGFISPILLFFLMIKITIPITENASIKSRGNLYIDYQKITPILFPFKIN